MKLFIFVEPVLQALRIRQVISHIPSGGVHLDLGCDNPPVLIDRIRGRMKRCIGIDSAVKPRKYANVEILRQELMQKVRLPGNSIDVITMLAVLEHLKYPEHIMQESFRVLKKGGVFLVTVPSPANKPLLEFLAVFSIVRKDMIEQHENYFTTQRLARMAKHVGFSKVSVSTFELGLNTFLKAVK